MPILPKSRRRSGDDARGAARLNAVDSVPNTSTTEWAQKFAGRTTTGEVLGDDEARENGSPNRPVYSAVAATLKRPTSERAGVGHGRGKHPRTVQRRMASMAEVLLAERKRLEIWLQAEQICKLAVANWRITIKPEAERLGYEDIHLYQKYAAVHTYAMYRAAGHPAIYASELAGQPSLHSGSIVREWANDFLRGVTKSSWSLSGTDCLSKDVMTFSPYAKGQHIEWLLSSEELQRKARKWIAKNAEVKGRPNRLPRASECMPTTSDPSDVP
jgi:hypothetical protein